jgi:hypothetical protein
MAGMMGADCIVASEPESNGNLLVDVFVEI